jgi:hypothetical protein
MRERFLSYFRTNTWWILTFLIFVITDAILTSILISNKLGIEANPFIRDSVHSFDWGFHLLRIDMAILLIPFIALTKWDFTRNWLLQSFTIGYAWTILNSLSILIIGVDISIYQFLPTYLYLVGFVAQFLLGLIILLLYRHLRTRVL